MCVGESVDGGNIMKQIFISCLFFIISFSFYSCTEGPDASLFNNMNELIITGKNKGNFDFDHMSIEMITHLYDNSNFDGVPEKRLTLMFTETNQQDSLVAVDEITVNFIDFVSPGNYYAYAFIDLNSNSDLDANEPFDVWLDDKGKPKVIEITEESRWKIIFEFEQVYNPIK